MVRKSRIGNSEQEMRDSSFSRDAFSRDAVIIHPAIVILIEMLKDSNGIIYVVSFTNI